MRPFRTAALLLLTTSALALAARELPRLPKDQAFPRGPESPGVVVFRHSSHVDPDRPDCTPCHPALFKILEKASTADGRPVRHKDMEAGRQCGTCHDGKAASDLTDCAKCHAD